MNTLIELAEWDDPQVQIAYRILCDDQGPPNLEEHWEGWVARRIIAALRASSEKQS